MSKPSPRIGFIGMGIMGAPMAGHLLVAGYDLTVHTRTRARANDLLSRGAKWAGTPRELVAGCDVVFICVTDTPDVQAVVSGPEGLLAGARPDVVIIDHSTISPAATRQMAQQVSAAGMTLLDAPVSGGDIGAQKATLSIMVGGDEEAFHSVKPLLERMGKTITWCGPSGSGQLTKLTNQILVSITNLAVCEALNFARAGGLDPQATIAAIGSGAGGSWQLSNLGPRMIAGDFAPGFMIDLQQKDLRLVLEAARENHRDLSATSMVHDLFSIAQQQGRGLDGTQALYVIVEETGKSDGRL